jgi:hypothetical protein
MTKKATAASLERDGRRDRNANSNGDRSVLAEIRSGLEILLGTGVHELRIPKAGRSRTVSGYYDDLDALARDAQLWDGRGPGIYGTVNPNVPALLARSANRAREHAESTTSDRDIARRTRLFIDLDPVRPSGIASTDAEHLAALDRARAIRSDLRAQGWPDPILMDSGNGAALFYAIDLPNDAESNGIGVGVLRGLASRYSDDVVAIDTTVSNAARIVRIPGTLNAKGDDTAERPHRRCRIIDAPDVLETVDVDELRTVAAWAPAEPARSSGTSGSTFDIDSFIGAHGFEIQSDGDWDGKRRIKLARCPFDAEHVGGSAALFVFESGAIAFTCFHNGCAGNDWRAVRDLFEPERQQRQQRDGERVHAREAAEPWANPVAWNHETTGPALALEALPKVIADYVTSVSESVQIAPDFVAASAIGVLAAAAGRRMEIAIGKTHREPLNLYMLPTLGPGERKVMLRKTAAPLYEAEAELAKAKAPDACRITEQRAMIEARVQQLRREAAKSDDPAVRDDRVTEAARLQEQMPDPSHPVCLVIDDATTEATARVLGEQGGVLSIVSEEAGALFEVLAGKYTKGEAVSLDIHLKAYDGGEIRVNRIGREPIVIPSACLSIVATPQPSLLARIAEQRDFRGRGLIGRCCFVVPASRVGTRTYRDRPVPEDIEAAWRELVLKVARLPIASAESVPAARIAGEALTEWARLADGIEADQREGGRLASVRDWASKHPARIARVAGLLHLVRHHDADQPAEIPVDIEDVAAAGVIGEWLLEHALVAFDRLAATPADDLARRLLAWIRRTRPTQFSRRDAHRAHQDNGATNATDIGIALDVLVERGFIRIKETDRREGHNGRPPAPEYDVNPMTLES